MSNQPLRICLIDDDEDYFVIVRDLLSEVQYTKYVLDWESTYAAGLAQIGQKRHEVYLVDYRLGARTGLELLREAAAQGCRAPVILLTGQGDREIDEEAIRAGAADYLVKDQVSPTVLERAIRHALERKRSEEQLSFQKTLLESQGEASIDGILVVSPHGEILSFNRRFVELWRLPPSIAESKSDEAALKSVLDKLVEPAAFLAKVRYLYDHPNEESHDEIALRDGRTFERYTAPVKSTSGILYGRVWYFRDITQRKLAELTQRRLVTAVEQSTEIVVITNPAAVIEYVNPAFEQITGYTQAEAVGQTPRLLKSGKHDAAFYTDLWQTLLAGKTWRGHLTNKKKDGSLYVVESNISPVRDAAGEVINYVSISRDISYERQIEEQLRQIQKMDAVGRLAGGVAHDFNNLLTVITGYCALLLQRKKSDDSGRHEIEEILKASERAASLTRQLLAFSRKQLLNPKELDLNSVIVGMDKMLRRLIGENIELRTALSPTPCTVKADAGQIEQVIMNLAVNARDAMPMGGKLIVETAVVTLESVSKYDQKGFTPGQYVRITVTDTGVGMSEKVKAHLFEPFFTTKETGKGTGLGLATSYGIIKQSGGHIIVYTEPGHGTCFKLYLPALNAVAHPVIAPASAPVAQRGSETILLVEDEEALRELAACILRESGFTVLAVSNGKEGLQIAQNHHGRGIDLVLTDVIMPEMGGKAMIEQLRPFLPHAKVLFVSGYTDDALTQHGILEPGIAFLEKPFSPSRLTYKVREVLDSPEAVTA